MYVLKIKGTNGQWVEIKEINDSKDAAERILRGFKTAAKIAGMELGSVKLIKKETHEVL